MTTAAIPDRVERWRLPGKIPVLKATVVAVAYLLGAQIAFLIGTLSDRMFAPFWPPNIVLLCALILSPPRDWWIYLLAVFPAHVVAELGVGMPLPQLMVAFATNVAIALFSAIGMRMLLREPPWFGTARKALLYIAITTVAAPGLVAWGGAFVSILGGGGFENYWAHWVQWYLANAMMSLTIAPLALMILSGEGMLKALPFRKKLEGAALAALLAVVCVLAMRLSVNHLLGVLVPAIILLPLALVIWAAFRFGALGASAAVAVATIVAIQQTLSGPSPFIFASEEATVVGLQMFLIALAVPVLLLGAATEENRNAMQAAQSNQELMAMAAAAAEMCLWNYERDTGRLWMTENGRAIFGMDADQPLTRDSIVKSIHPDDRQFMIEAIRSAAANATLANVEFRIVRPDNEIKWLRARGRTRRVAPGDVEFVSGTFTDVTERRNAEHEVALRQGEMAHLMRVSMLGELSGGIAHELAQPLTAILSNAQAARVMMNSSTPDIAEIADTLDDIISDDNRAGEVLHRMRGFLKRGEAKFETTDINEIISSTLQLLRSELINRRVKVSCTFDDALPLICGDRIQMQQVLLNLVMNAADAMADQVPSRRVITVYTRALSDGDIGINVMDQGAGLAPGQEERAFEPFFTTKERGLGLGLSICSSIVKAHGGTLQLSNNSTGGATAAFTLPRHN